MWCAAADGTSFTDVPAGHYLLVTDFSMAPFPSADGPFDGSVSQVNGTTSIYYVFLITPRRATVSEHYITPCFVVPPGDHLGAKNNAGSTSMAWFYVSGLLTTNYNYLPMLVR